MRVPPKDVVASNGRPSAVARRIAATILFADATPKEPPRNRNSFATTATGRPLLTPTENGARNAAWVLVIVATLTIYGSCNNDVHDTN